MKKNNPLIPTDEELVALAKDESYEAFEQLMHRYEKPLYNLALRITKNPENAEEVLQDTFLSVFRKIDGFRGDSSFKTWIYRVATNFALMKIRGNKKKVQVFLDEPIRSNGDEIPRDVPDWRENPQDAYEKGELRNIIKEAVESLPEIYRTVFYLRDIEGFSNNEVAEVLNLSLPAVKSRILRARLLMRDKLSAYVKTEE